jgi:hypothetical protein
MHINDETRDEAAQTLALASCGLQTGYSCRASGEPGAIQKREKENLLRAIEIGGPQLNVLVERLTQKEERIVQLEAEIRTLQGHLRSRALDADQVAKLLEGSFIKLGDTLRSDLGQAREALRSMLTEKIRFTPLRLPTGERTYRLAFELGVGSLIADPAQRCRRVYVPDGI